jgi:PAS domain S-box-containing protein
MDEEIPGDAAQLRQKAEELAAQKPENHNEPAAHRDELLHELEVHQIELELQNEELRRTQQQLQASRDRYSDLFEFAPVGYFTLDPVLHIVEANLTGTQLLGVERQNLSGQRFSKFVTPECQDAFHLYFGTDRGVGEKGLEIDMRRRRGTPFSAELRITAERSEDTPDCFYRVALIDVSKRKLAESALSQSEKKYRMLVQAANSIILRWDARGIIKFINEYGLCFFGYSHEELIGSSVMKIMPRNEKISGRFPAAFIQDIVRNPNRYTNVPNENLRKDGTTAWIAWTNKPIVDADGGVQEILAVGNDITPLKEAQSALQQSEKKYRQLFESMGEGFLLIEPILNESGRPVSYRYLDANPAFEMMIHLGLKDIIGKDNREVLPGIEPYWIRFFGQVALTGKSGHIEQFSKDLDGWYSVHAYCPEPGKAALVYTNVTQRRQAEKRLRQSWGDLDRAQEVGLIGSWRMDIRKNKLTWSDENY